MILLKRVHQIVERIVHSRSNFAEALCIRGPEHDDLIEIVFGLEVTDVLTEELQVLFLATRFQDVVCAILLVSCDEIFVVDRGERDHFFHIWSKLLLEIPIEHFSPFHGISQVHLGNVPAADHDVDGIDQRNHFA